MDRKTEIKSQPWWVIFLIIPILISCTAFTPLTSIRTVSNTSVASLGGVSKSLRKVFRFIRKKRSKKNMPVRKEVRFIEKKPSKKNMRVLIERIIDTIASMPGYVIPDSDNPLHGTFSQPIKFDITNQKTQEHRVFKLDHPTLDWHPETSTWELDSKSKARLMEIIREQKSNDSPENS